MEYLVRLILLSDKGKGVYNLGSGKGVTLDKIRIIIENQLNHQLETDKLGDKLNEIEFSLQYILQAHFPLVNLSFYITYLRRNYLCLKGFCNAIRTPKVKDSRFLEKRG